MLGGRHEVGVDGLDVARIRLSAPARHEALYDRARIIDASLGDHGDAEAAGGLRHEGHGHDGDVREVLSRRVVVDIEQRLETPPRREHRNGRLHVDAHVAGVHRDGVGLRGRQAGVELVVDEQAPDVAEGHPAHEVFDIDAAVAQ